ncbi:MAG TPA: CHAD domain-containing protein [Verrucomicrobiales bacterium]|nr:CHAD domain-containing protein [Verrucomicrobiales bacterium]
MDFQLQRDETVQDGIRRLAVEQIEAACGHLENYASDPETSVHEFRKCSKRLRSLLRLIRPGAPRLARRENRRFRDLASRLGKIRDAAVARRCLEALEKEGGKKCEAIGARLERDRLRPEAAEGQEVVDAVLLGMREARKEVDAWEFGEEKGVRLISGGFRSTMRKSRRAWRKLERTRSIEASHELRKRLKHLWHQAEVLHNASPKWMKRLERALDEATDALGLAHDVAVLEERAVRGAKKKSPVAEEWRKLQPVAERRRRKLEEKALRQCRKSLSRAPAKAERQLLQDWRKWRG